MQLSYMEQAIWQANAAFDRGEVPVGAVIVEHTTGKIIAKAGNQTIALSNPLAHAEMNVIAQACQHMSYLTSCDLYVTLEPCPMCAQAISAARLRRLYFGAYDAKSGGVEHGPRIYDHRSAHHKPEVYGGIEEKRCAELLKRFFHLQRST